MKGIEFDSEDISSLGQDLFCKTPEALETVLAKLREIGYEVKDLRGNTDFFKRYPAELIDRYGTMLWQATLDVRHGKCGSCKQYIETRGIRSHGRRCEKCGQVVYLMLPKGSQFRFEFRTKKPIAMGPQLCMKVVHWDVDAGLLYLEPKPLDDGSPSVVVDQKASDYLSKHVDKWELVVFKGQSVLRVRYVFPGIGLVRSDSVECYGITGGYSNYEIVRVLDGKEYSEYSLDFPLQEYIHVYELWHFAKRPQTAESTR